MTSRFAQPTSQTLRHLQRYAALFLLPLLAMACEQAAAPSATSGVGSATGAPISVAEAGSENGDVALGRVSAATYRITVTNASGALQPLTPSVVALHNPAADIFTVGSPASPMLERIAESGMNGPLVSALESANRVFDVAVAFGTVNGGPGPILPGASAHVEVQGPPGGRLSLVSMLVCTNDGFTGLDGVRLPNRVDESITLHSNGYDAGTEQNTEASSDLVPPCLMVTTGMMGGTGADQPSIAENEVIRHHPGIDGDADGADILDAQHQWTEPVASIKIERID